MTRHVLFTAVKNEAPFLLEWIAYHKVIGFDTVIVYSNPSDDGTDELLAALAEAGELTHVTHVPPPGVSPQGNAARLANEAGLIQEGDWVIWLDADEFLNIHIGQGQVEDLAWAIGEKQGMLIPWRIFGDGGNARFPGRFVSAQFTQATSGWFAPTREIKTFFRTGNKIEGFSQNGINRPKITKNSGLRISDFLTGAGHTLSVQNESTGWLDGDDLASTNRVKKPDFSWKLAQINHYMVRTPEFFALKKARGRGWAPDQAGAANTRHTEKFYTDMNRNDRVDTSILRHQTAVDAEIVRLKSIPSVAEADALAERRTALALVKAACRRPADPSVMPAAFELTLPPAEANMMRQTYAGAGVVLEYGSGGSTFVAAEAAGEVVSVENDPDWALRMTTALDNGGLGAGARIHFADTGIVGDWGRPVHDTAFRRYHQYACDVWDRTWFKHPDVILIDGRFRVACLINAIFRAAKPMTVLFDDYGDRPGYFWVEGILKQREMVGRMAVFDVVPGIVIPPALISRAFGSFTDAD